MDIEELPEAEPDPFLVAILAVKQSLQEQGERMNRLAKKLVTDKAVGWHEGYAEAMTDAVRRLDNLVR